MREWARRIVKCVGLMGEGRQRGYSSGQETKGVAGPLRGRSP